jgi:predicted metal-dependent hydrolase
MAELTSNRYCPSRPLPPYSYVPGLAPHPTSDPQGHSFRHPPTTPPALTEASYQNNNEYLYAIDLFNHGFYWEAHEAWEGLWHAAGRHGPSADFLKGLIKLAAAGVKAKEGRTTGVLRHAHRAAELFRAAAAGLNSETATMFGLRLNDLLSSAKQVADQAQALTIEGQPLAARRLPVQLQLNYQQ